jgi:hypothetical protein
MPILFQPLDTVRNPLSVTEKIIGGLTKLFGPDKASNDHASCGAACPHLAVEDDGVQLLGLPDGLVELVKNSLSWRGAIRDWHSVVVHPVALRRQSLIHLPGCLDVLAAYI